MTSYDYHQEALASARKIARDHLEAKGGETWQKCQALERRENWEARDIIFERIRFPRNIARNWKQLLEKERQGWIRWHKESWKGALPTRNPITRKEVIRLAIRVELANPHIPMSDRLVKGEEG